MGLQFSEAYLKSKPSMASSIRELTVRAEKSMQNIVTNINLFENWLNISEQNPSYNTFRHFPLIERTELREQMRIALSHKTFVYHNDPDEFRDELEYCGYHQTLAAMDKRPQVEKTRKGNFGEILACEYLEYVEGYEIPVKRFRYNPHPNLSMRGEDALAFQFGDANGQNRKICVVESKVQNRFNVTNTRNAVQDQLATRKYIVSIMFVSQVLWDKGEKDKSRAVREFINRTMPNAPIRNDFLMLITGNNPENPFDVITQIDLAGVNLTATNLSLENLSGFVKDLYEAEIDESLL